MIKIPNCNECRECCGFVMYAGKTLSIKKMNKHFSFNERLCSLFFTKENNSFRLGMFCKQYDLGSCKIYGSETYPLACALYPFLIAETKKGKYNLIIDRNCPYWRVALPQKEEAINLINQYAQKDELDIFPEKNLIRMGYKIVTVIKDLEFSNLPSTK